jgi:hypothetical protein
MGERFSYFMFLLLAGIAGLLTALLIHWFTWKMRSNYPSVTMIGGALGALGLTGFCLLFLSSDIANMALTALAILWIVAILLGVLQAVALKIPWWRGVLGVFFEMALAFLAGAAVNLGLQNLIAWFRQNFPGVDVYAVINSFLWTMIIALLVLALARPLLLRRSAQVGP